MSYLEPLWLEVALSAETEDVGARVEFITLATLFEASVALNRENGSVTSRGAEVVLMTASLELIAEVVGVTF